MTDNERPRMPIQPKVTDENGTELFAENRLVTCLLDKGGLDLNHLAKRVRAGKATENEFFQLRQLIGYNVSGLPYPDDVSYSEVESAHNNPEIEQNKARALFYADRIKDIRDKLAEGIIRLYTIEEDEQPRIGPEELQKIRESLTEGLGLLYEIHPDDFLTGDFDHE